MTSEDYVGICTFKVFFFFSLLLPPSLVVLDRREDRFCMKSLMLTFDQLNGTKCVYPVCLL